MVNGISIGVFNAIGDSILITVKDTIFLNYFRFGNSSFSF